MTKPLLILLIILIWAAIPLAAFAADTIHISTAADDAYEYQASGFVSWEADQITIDAGSFAAMRFPLGVATGTSASDAHITLTANGPTLFCSHMPIRLETSDNAADYQYGDTIWSRSYTTNAIVATVPPLAEDGDTWTSPNLAILVNQILSRPGWRPGNYIAIVVGPCAGSTELAELHSYDTDPAKAPRLDITWSEPTGIYIVTLPSGGQATISMEVSAGQVLVAIGLAGIVTLLLYRQLRSLSHIST